MSDFAAAWAAARDVHGWLTEVQARRLWGCARVLRPPARIVEIGSFQGRSTVVLASGAPPGVEVVAIDPHLGSDRGPQEIAEHRAAGDADALAFEANLARAGVRDRVRWVRRRSQEALEEVDGPIDVLYVDGAHRYAPALDDLERWGARVVPGGVMLVHDAFASIGVTGALLRAVTLSPAWRYVARDGSLAEFTRVDLAPGERALDAAVQLSQLPWFARNLVLKGLIAARLRRGPWPY